MSNRGDKKAILKKAFTLAIAFIFLFTQTVWAVKTICYIPEGPIRSVPQYNPDTGFCETWPLDEHNNCPERYLYSQKFGKCLDLPKCTDGYLYDLLTKQCVPPSNQTQLGTGDNDTVPYDQICAMDKNGDGEINEDEIAECITADDGSKICPLDAAPCQAKYTVPDCPSGYTYNNQTKTCQTNPTCLPGLIFDGQKCSQGVFCPSGGSVRNVNGQWKCVVGASSDCPDGGQIRYQNGQPICVASGCQNGGIVVYLYWDWRCILPYSSWGCPSGYYSLLGMYPCTYTSCDPSSILCVSKINCPPGYVYDFGLQACKTQPRNNCPSGYKYDSSSNLCVTDIPCPPGSTYDPKSQSCVAPPSCIPGGSFNQKIGKCEGSAYCPSGSTLTNNGCLMGYFCPYGNYPCKPVNGVLECSAKQCVTAKDVQEEIEDEPELTDYKNDGPRDPNGQCLGQVYIFNGEVHKCLSKKEINIGFKLKNGCCDENLVKNKIYDSTGSIANNFALLKYAAAAIKYSYDIVDFGYLFLRGTNYVEMGKDFVLISKIPFNEISDISKAEILSFDINSPEGIAIKNLVSKYGTEIKGGTDVAVDAMSNYVQSLGKTIAIAIIHTAISGIIKDPLAASIVNLAADIALKVFFNISLGPLGWVGAVIEIIISFFMEMKCNKEDYITVALEKSGRCHYVDEKCKTKGFIVTKKKCWKIYCCFNSKLARIIHEQGRPQLNTDIRSWGTKKSPNCRGFTPEEFASLDFDKMDLREYFEDIERNIAKDIETNVQQLFNESIQTQFSY